MPVTSTSLRHKRVVTVLYSLELGGAERQATALARYLSSAEGAQVEVWAFIGPGKAADLCEEYGIAWRLVSAIPWPKSDIDVGRSAVTLSRHLRRFRPDAVLSYLLYPNVVTAFARRFARTPFHLWNQRNPGTEKLPLRLAGLAARSADVCVANSQEGREYLRRTLKVPEKRLKVVPNGVTLSPPVKTRAAWRRDLNIEESSPVACMLANITSYKDYPTLLRAWRLVVDRWGPKPNRPVLLLAGREGDAFEQIRSLVSDLGLENVVWFLGAVDDVASLLNAVEIGVLSSPSEGCPNAVLEYMASGLPVAGSDVAGIRDVLPPEGLPFLSPCGDANGLAVTLEHLLADKDLRLSLGDKNRHWAEHEFSFDAQCRKAASLIKEGIALRHR